MDETEPQPLIVGRRVEAWHGHREGQHGEVVRVHGWGWWIVRWDDGAEDRYWSSDLVREETEDDRRQLEVLRALARMSRLTTSAAVMVSAIPPTRRVTLGGSTLPAACGIDPWTSPIRLWLELTGRSERPETDAMTWGKRLQPVIFEALRDDGYDLALTDGSEASDAARPWLVGHPDAWVAVRGEWGIVEAKAVGKWSPSANGGPQPNYEAQVQTYLHLTGLDAGLLAVLIGGQKLELHEIERNQRAIDTLLELGERFMEYVRRDSPPSAAGHPDDRAALAEAFPQHERGKVVRASRELVADVRLLAKVKEQGKAVKAREAAIAARVTEAMGDAETLIGLHDEPLATWKAVASRRVNTEKLKRDFPVVYEAVADSTSTRRLNLA